MGKVATGFSTGLATNLETRRVKERLKAWFSGRIGPKEKLKGLSYLLIYHWFRGRFPGRADRSIKTKGATGINLANYSSRGTWQKTEILVGIGRFPNRAGNFNGATISFPYWQNQFYFFPQKI